MKRRKAVRFYYFLLLHKVFEGLKQFGRQQHSRRQLIERVATRKVQARVFYRWSTYVHQRQREAIKFRLHWTQCAFHAWQGFHQRAVQRTRLVRTAEHFHRTSLLRRSFSRWREVLAIRNQRRVQAEAGFERHQAQTSRAHVVQAFERWRCFVQRRLAQQLVHYQARTHWQVAVTTRVFDAWVQYVGMRRWDEILYLRAAKHRAHVVRKHVLSNWRHNAVVCRTSRAQTVTALAHWKLSMQRKAFHGWLLRVRARQAKRYHLHEALEWRHAHFLQVGLVHWAQAAFALREQRLLQVQTHAATVAARLWRRVARISAHWRYVAKHRIIQGGRQNKAVAFHPLPTKARRAEEVIQPLGMASVAVATTIHHRLPPRKPLELLYDGDFVPSTTTRPKESTAAAMHVGIEKYGMSMPMSQAPRRLHASAESEGDDIERVVRDMESRMLYWQERRQSWKAHKKHLDALRKHLATSAGDSSYDMMRRTLEVMEETHLEHVAALASSKAEMASFARQIDQLHRRRGDAVIPN
ncbi:hypothetical protein H310_02263 [Aphanomyces invadans]|uniref:Sfi1 spindle body domain-containing protein n=1 Tax=Aphanomyces invadans TaxID=157072 RepID=A0A024UNT4_9STRA|nr:hypothetical protein H310_02263 [Aphanomyces invadans]ETW07840.1 hypothetical protein H310_02263 [Aphanomyces invadans]|eukprot:XP_008863933.1 hypothetical protein H310_02263 [Aphanomyces invadans]